MAVFDCTMYLNEDDLYEIRLNQHWDFVDKFIVVEAGETHTGLKKPLKFDHERFKKYREKLVYVSFDSFDDQMAKFPQYLDSTAIADRGPRMESKDWTRDHFQFNYIVEILKNLGAKDDDISIISCLDEIVKKEAFESLLPLFADKTFLSPDGFRPVFVLHQYLYAYKFNLLHKHWVDNISGMVTEVGNFQKMLPATLREKGIMTHTPVQDAGWHFTFLDKTDGEMVLEKQRSWAHSKDVYQGQKLKFENTTKEEAITRFFHDYHVEMVPVTLETHPEYIVNNLDKFRNFIYENDDETV